MNRRIGFLFKLLWLLCGIFGRLTPSIYAQTAATITIYRPTLSQGDTGEVEARLDCGAKQCSLFSIILEFDPEAIQISDVELGLYLGSQAQGIVFVLDNTVDNADGTLTLSAAAMGTPPPPEDDVLFRFSVLALREGEVDLRVKSLELGDLEAHPVSTIVQIIGPQDATETAASVSPSIINVTAIASPSVPLVTATPRPAEFQTYARVFTRYGDTLNLRSLPSVNAEILEELPYGTVVGVIDGPVIAGGFTWWQLSSPTGRVGWSVEAADNVQVLQFSSNLTILLYSSIENVGRAPLFHYGQQVTGLAGSGVWKRPAPDYGSIRWTLSSVTTFAIGGVPYGGFASDGTPTWWYYVEIPGGDQQFRGWLPEYQLRAT